MSLKEIIRRLAQSAEVPDTPEKWVFYPNLFVGGA